MRRQKFYKMHLFLTLILLIISTAITIIMEIQTYLYGTTVVVIRTPHEILVGADSKMIAIGDKPSDAGLTCKIAQVDNLFFAHARLIKDSAQFIAVCSSAKTYEIGENLLSVSDPISRP